MGGADGAWDRDSLASALVLGHRYSVDISRVACEALGITDVSNSEVLTLFLLHRARSMTPSELVAATGISRSTMARVVNGVEALGLVSRRRDAVDRRRVLVELTVKGRRRVTKAQSRLADLYEAGDIAVKEAIGHLDDAGLRTASHEPARARDATESMAATGLAYVADVVGALEAYGVSEAADRFVLALLDLNDQMRPTQLSHELGMTPGGISGLLTRLEAEGLVVRAHGETPGDRRAVTVALTERGREAAAVQLDVFARHARDIFQSLAATAPPG